MKSLLSSTSQTKDTRNLSRRWPPRGTWTLQALQDSMAVTLLYKNTCLADSPVWKKKKTSHDIWTSIARRQTCSTALCSLNQTTKTYEISGYQQVGLYSTGGIHQTELFFAVS